MKSKADEMVRYFQRHNLNFVVQFHNLVRHLIKEKRSSPEAKHDPWLESVLESHEKLNGRNALLMLLAHLEEVLILRWRSRRRGEPIPRGSSIKRFVPLLRVCGCEPGAMPSWTLIQDAYTLRNCLLHTNGRVSLMKDPDEVTACVARHKPTLKKAGDRLEVAPEFLEKLAQAIDEVQGILATGSLTMQ
jgi:hypothetical protein